jgi:Tfp pilus assembly protein PilP
MMAKATLSLVLVAACAGWAQSPQIVSNARSKVQEAQKTWNAHNPAPAKAAPAPKAASKPPAKNAAHASSTPAKAGKAQAIAGLGLPSANSLLPKDEVNTAAGEEHFTTAAQHDAGKRDPFLSPVVARVTGPTNCSGGKKCLAIDQIALKGIVRSDNGMIAVVTNAANKAYFLRENDPVFNGYVAKITGDSVTFKETVQDNMGHRSTRDVVKKIFTPAV